MPKWLLNITKKTILKFRLQTMQAWEFYGMESFMEFYGKFYDGHSFALLCQQIWTQPETIKRKKKAAANDWFPYSRGRTAALLVAKGTCLFRMQLVGSVLWRVSLNHSHMCSSCISGVRIIILDGFQVLCCPQIWETMEGPEQRDEEHNTCSCRNCKPCTFPNSLAQQLPKCVFRRCDMSLMRAVMTYLHSKLWAAFPFLLLFSTFHLYTTLITASSAIPERREIEPFRLLHGDRDELNNVVKLLVFMYLQEKTFF